MKRIDLCGAWEGRCLIPDGNNFDFAGTVPGCAISDLVAAGRLPRDLFWRDNADAVLPYENYDYVYRKHFAFSGSAEGAILRFERIDTYADVYLNGTLVYHSENGNIRHDIEVEKNLKTGENLLEVRLYSPTEWVKDRPWRKASFGTYERLYTRREQCTYGWDWVARFVTVGLGECSLLLPEEGEVTTENVYITTLDADNESATVRIDVGFDRAYEGRILNFEILSPEGDTVCCKRKYCAEDFVRVELDVPAPRLWYPLGYGDHPLYTFVLTDGEKTVYRESFGIRTVKIMQLPDAKNSTAYAKCLSIQNPEYDHNETFSGFVVKINGKTIQCLGANWVPCVPYECGSVEERQTEILELCVEAGVNMLRVWGGGAFESKHFYSECSRLGIAVTQDFLMACGVYPEEEDWFTQELQKEALYAARLCRNQPCLLWWSGDNENAVHGSDTDEDYRGRRSAYAGIAPVLYREDPCRRFLPSSPYGGSFYASNTVGTTHNTQYMSFLFRYLREHEDLSDYKEELKKFRARFIAEEPQLGAASLTSLRRFMTEEDIFGESEDMWLFHMRSNPKRLTELYDHLHLFTKGVFGPYRDTHDRLFKLRYMQFEWIRVVMEQARRERDLCSGIILWMMNDCWPSSAGWALIDYYNLPKDGFYSFKRCAKPLLASIDCEETTYRVHVINEGEETAVTGQVRLLSADRKTVKAIGDFACTVCENSSDVLFKTNIPLADGELLICDVESKKGCDRAFYKNGALPLIPAAVEYTVDEEKGTITLTATEQYLHAVTVTGNLILTDNCFSLLPHESRTVNYRPADPTAPIDLSVEGYTVG